MNRPIAAVALTLVFGIADGALQGCAGPTPYIREGDATRVEVGFAGDVASALPLARQHCAQFERVARLVDAGLDSALYECVRP